MNSKQKGASGERELANLLKQQGYPEARRSVQYNGMLGGADVVGVKGLHIECKRAQAVRDELYIQQAERDSKAGDIPIVMYRRNGEQWKALLRQDFFMAIWSELTESQKQNIRKKTEFYKKVGKVGQK